MYTCHNSIGIKYYTRLALGLRHLRYQNCYSSYENTVD